MHEELKKLAAEIGFGYKIVNKSTCALANRDGISKIFVTDMVILNDNSSSTLYTDDHICKAGRYYVQSYNKKSVCTEDRRIHTLDSTLNLIRVLVVQDL